MEHALSPFVSEWSKSYSRMRYAASCTSLNRPIRTIAGTGATQTNDSHAAPFSAQPEFLVYVLGPIQSIPMDE
jgi:hypothetical protein